MFGMTDRAAARLPFALDTAADALRAALARARDFREERRLAALQRLSARRPDDAAVSAELGRQYERLGHARDAASCYLAAAARCHGEERVQDLRLFCRRLEALGERLEAARLYRDLANTCGRAGRYAEAALACRRVVELYVAEGQYQTARGYMRLLPALGHLEASTRTELRDRVELYAPPAAIEPEVERRAEVEPPRRARYDLEAFREIAAILSGETRERRPASAVAPRPAPETRKTEPAPARKAAAAVAPVREAAAAPEAPPTLPIARPEGFESTAVVEDEQTGPARLTTRLDEPLAADLHFRPSRKTSRLDEASTLVDPNVFLCGSLGVITAADVAQIVETNAVTAKFDLFGEDGPGALYFDRGRLVAARSGGLRGREAAKRLVLSDVGPFRVVLVDSVERDDLGASGSTAALLMELAREMDESERGAHEAPRKVTRNLARRGAE